MQIKYYETVWRDISNSPGWIGKLCLLALVNLIPIFGQIVMLGYLYGWAREIAWGVNAPMPSKLICNDDGKFWTRGWFILVLTFVFALIPSIVMNIGMGMQGSGVWMLSSHSHAAANSVMAGLGALVYFVGVLGAFLMSILAWIGSIRIAIYNRLSAGFQFGKIWKMFRHDTGGVFRIFGMELIFSLILGIILSIVMTVLMIAVVFAGVSGLAAAGYTPSTLQHLTDAQAMQLTAQFIASAGIVGIICLLVICYAVSLVCTFIYMLVYRAVGYWTNQFDVAHWRGQDDPMPFEMLAPAPVMPAQPVQSNYASQQYQPGQSGYADQSGQPGQPVQSVQPGQPYQSGQPNQQYQPAQPAQPTQPVIPAVQQAAPIAVPVADATQPMETEPVESVAATPAEEAPITSDEILPAEESPAIGENAPTEADGFVAPANEEESQ